MFVQGESRTDRWEQQQVTYYRVRVYAHKLVLLTPKAKAASEADDFGTDTGEHAPLHKVFDEEQP